jgi:hypothetical protein
MKVGRKSKKLVSAQGAEEGGLKTRQESSNVRIAGKT